MSGAAVTTGTISLAVTIVGGWLWVSSYFVTQTDADTIHASLAREISKTYYEVKIASANAELAFIEKGGVEEGERRTYELRKFEVQFMTTKLNELRR